MKTIKRTIILGVAAFSAACACAQTGWVSVESTIPEASTAVKTENDISMMWGIFGPGTGYVTSGLQSTPQGSWNVLYKNMGSATETFYEGDSSRLLLYCGSNNVSVFSQAYSTFTLSDEVLQADKARLSFDLNYVGNMTDVNVVINIPDWEVIEIKPEFRMGVLSDEPYQPSGKFVFGLVNLANGEIYSADISSASESHLMGFEDSSWFIFNENADGTISVSFELDSTQLQTITEAGLGLYVRSAKTGMLEVYQIGNFAVEVFNDIPEPSVYAAMAGLLALTVCLCTRKRRAAS